MGLREFEMTQSFDEWFIKASQNKLFWESPSKSSKMGYEAGAASRQAEIDKLEVEIKETQAFLNNQNHIKQTRIDELQTKLKSTKQSADEAIGAMSISIHKRNKENESLNRVVDELQKKIDDAIKLIEPSDEISNKLYRKVFKILKGKQND